MKSIPQFESLDYLILRFLGDYGCGSAQSRKLPVSNHSVETLYRLGLSFLVFRGIETDTIEVSDEMHELVLSAELTARVLRGEIDAVLEQFLAIAAAYSIPVVLLKGAANAEELYQQPHHRTMGDVDVLVSPENAELLYRELLDHGYQPMDRRRGMIWAEGHHHLQPLRHPQNKIPIELHTALFSRNKPNLSPIFDPAHVWASTRRDGFRDHSCLRLTRELDLLYTTAHWALDPSVLVNAVGIVDVARMLEIRGSRMDWGQIRSWLVNSPRLADFLSVILGVLERESVANVPDAIRGNLDDSVQRMGRLNLRILQSILRSFPLAGRQKIARCLTREHADIIWNTLLDPANQDRRLAVATSRILNLRRQPGEPLIVSLLRRARRSVGSDD